MTEHTPDPAASPNSKAESNAESQPPSQPAPTTTPAPDPQPSTDQTDPKDAAVALAKRAGQKIIKHPIGKLAAVTIGVLFGLAIETGVGATGILGPGVDQLIAQQAEGFTALESKLEALRNSTDPAQTQQLTAELQTLLSQQQQLGQRTETELRTAQAEIQKLREQVLETKGATTGADTWLMPGESITVAGKPGNNFGFNSFTYSHHTNDITVNVSGQKTRMVIGDAAEFPDEHGTWKVIYKIAQKRTDGRVGFDIVFVPTQ